MSIIQSRLRQWAERGAIAPEHVARAREIAGLQPTPRAWRQFFEHLLLGNGGALLLAALLFFFAANWDALGRYSHFALLELLIVAALAGWWLFRERAFGQACLTGAAVVLGVLLAYFGQTYQTGADTWQLFAVWAALITPWTLLGRSASLCLLWLLLANLALALYHRVSPNLFGLMSGPDRLVWSVFVLNSLALAAWEWQSGRRPWLASRGGPRLLAVASGFALSWQVMAAIVEPKAATALILPLYAVWCVVITRVYRHIKPDLFMLAGLSLSLLAVSTVVLGRWLLHGRDLLAFFLMGAWVIAASTVALRWLRARQEEMSHE